MRRIVLLSVALFVLLLPAAASATVYTPPTSPFTEPEIVTKASTCQQDERSPSTNSEHYQYETSLNTVKACIFDEYSLNRLFWLTDEIVHLREVDESLKSELVKSLGSEGTIAKDLSTLTTDLTPSEGLPVKFKTAQAVSLASLPELPSGTKTIGDVVLGSGTNSIGKAEVTALPELHAGTQTIGKVKDEIEAIKSGLYLPVEALGASSVKVTELLGEPIVKAAESGVWKAVGAAIEGVADVKCSEGCGGGGGGASSEVKVTNEPDKPSLEVVEANQAADKALGETSAENLEQAIMIVVGAMAGIFFLGLVRNIWGTAAG